MSESEYYIEWCAELQAEVKMLRDALESVEWVRMPSGHRDEEDRCPWCGGSPLDSEELMAGLTEHKLGCARQVALGLDKEGGET